MAKRFTSKNGVTIAVCRKLAEFAFGPSNSFAVRYNYPESRYDIYIRSREGIENQIEWFKKYWGADFHIIPMVEDEIHTIPSTHGNEYVA